MDGSASSDLHPGNPDDAPPADLPNIADYWPDAPHRMGPEADWYPEEGEPAAAAAPPYAPQAHPDLLLAPPPRPARRGLRVVLAALAAVVFLGGSGLVLARMVLGDGEPAARVTAAPAPPQTGDAGPDQPNPPVSVAPAPDPSASVAPSTTAPSEAPLPFTSGTFELTGSVVELNVTVAALGNEPVRFSIPDGSGLQPRLSRDGSTVKLDPRPVGDKGSGRLDVRLNSKVTWSIRMGGGVTRGSFALANAKLRRIDLTGGATRLAMALPVPGEKLPIRMTGGVNTWDITTAKKVPVKVLLRDGGGEVDLNGRRVRNIERDAVVRAGGSDDVESGGLDIDAVAGLGTLTVSPAD